MFFLKDLPQAETVAGYTGSLSDARTVVDELTALRRASLMLRALEQYFSAHGLSQQKFLILIVIDREQDRDSLRLSEIAQRLDVSKPVLHRTLRAMVAGGLLVARPDPEDGRAEQIGLTPAGQTLLQQVLPGYFDILLKGPEAAGHA